MTYDNPLHSRSRDLAMRDVALRMKERRPAAPTMHLEEARQLIYSSLERIGTLLPPETQAPFYGIAVDLLPRGLFNAYACFPKQQPAYVLIDTGTFDFFGNLAAVFSLLTENADGMLPRPFTEQRLIDYIWAAGLMYYAGIDDLEGHGSEVRDAERLGVVHAPKLHFAQLPAQFRTSALDLSMGAVVFLVCHEIAHILNRKHPSLSESMDFSFCRNMENHLDEQLADAMAFQLMVDYSIRFPDPVKVKCLLSSVDFALTCIGLMQSAFPHFWLEHGGDGRFVAVRESLDHPIAAARRESYRKFVASRIPPTFFTLPDRFGAIERRYGTLIRKGATPSAAFRESTALSRLIELMSSGPEKTHS